MAKKKFCECTLFTDERSNIKKNLYMFVVSGRGVYLSYCKMEGYALLFQDKCPASDHNAAAFPVRGRLCYSEYIIYSMTIHGGKGVQCRLGSRLYYLALCRRSVEQITGWKDFS